jgi:hypothetical protein
MKAKLLFRRALRWTPWAVALFVATWWANQAQWGSLPEVLAGYWWTMPLALASLVYLDFVSGRQKTEQKKRIADLRSQLSPLSGSEQDSAPPGYRIN